MSINDPVCWNPLYLFIYLFGTNGEIDPLQKENSKLSFPFFLAVMNLLMMLPAALGFLNLLLLVCWLA